MGVPCLQYGAGGVASLTCPIPVHYLGLVRRRLRNMLVYTHGITSGQTNFTQHNK